MKYIGIKLKLKDYGEVSVIAAGENQDRHKAIVRALSQYNIAVTFKLIVYIKSKIEVLHNYDERQLINECMVIINAYISNKIIQKKKSFETQNSKRLRDIDIMYNIIQYINYGYSIERIHNLVDIIGNDCHEKINLGDILCLVAELSITEPELATTDTNNQVSRLSANNIQKQVCAMMDKNTLLKYRSMNSLVPLALYLIQPNVLSKLDNKGGCEQIHQEITNSRSGYDNHTFESFDNIEKDIVKTRLAISLDTLRQLNKTEIMGYMLINPILQVGTDTVILDTSVLYSVYCSDYIERFINTKNKQRLNAEYGYAQEVFIEKIVNRVFRNECIHIEKVKETGKNKSHDFNVYMGDSVVIHAESKFAIGKVTTHYKKGNTDDKAIKQLRESDEHGIQNIIINTTSTYLFEYKTHDNIKVRSLSILGFIGYLHMIQENEKIYRDNICEDTLVLEVVGAELVLNSLKQEFNT